MERNDGRPFTFYTSEDLLSRVERVQTALQDRIVGSAENASTPSLSRSYVIRAAVERGLKSLEAELGLGAAE